MMMRSPVVNDRVLAQKDSRVQRLLDSYSENGKVIDELFISTLSRSPCPLKRRWRLALWNTTGLKARKTYNGPC